MKQFLIFLSVAMFVFAGAMSDAEARRFGGGGSFGMKRQVAPPKAPQQNLNRPANQAPATGAKPGRSWMGPIAGLAAGLGLAALFSHLGLGEGMANFMMLLLLVFAGFMLFRWFARRAGSGLQPATATGRMQDSRNAAMPFQQPAAAAASTGVDARQFGDFDVDTFVKQAKVNFIRLQMANDEGNLDDIREFTTPEMFAEIRLQLAERGNEANRTDVVELYAEVLDVEEEAARYIVSVRFHGLIREQQDAAPESFDEIWHLVKSRTTDRGWVIAGIQQAA